MFEFIIPLLYKYGFLAVLLGVSAEGLMIPIPSEIVVPFGGFLASRHLFPLWVLIILASTLNFLGSLLIFLLGKRLIPFIHKFKFLETHLIMSENFFKKFGDKAVLIGRSLPAVRMFISLPAGMSHMPFKKFVISSAIGTFFWYTILSCLGFFLGEYWGIVSQYWKYFTLLVIVMLPIAFFFYKKFEHRLIDYA